MFYIVASLAPQYGSRDNKRVLFNARVKKLIHTEKNQCKINNNKHDSTFFKNDFASYLIPVNLTCLLYSF